MPARRAAQTKVRTKLARRRVAAGVTQSAMARWVGISRSSYVRLETGRLKNPPLRWLANCAAVLRCDLADVVEDEMLSWSALSPGAELPPTLRQVSEDELVDREELVARSQRGKERRALVERKLADQSRLREERRKRAEKE